MELKEIGTMVESIGTKFTESKAALESRMARLEAAGRRMDLGNDGPGLSECSLDGWIRKGDVAGLETRALSISGDGQDVTVRDQWADRIFRLIRETSPIRQVANVMQTSSNELSVLVDRGEPTSAWVAETGSRTATATSFMTRHPISVHEHYSYPSATNALLDDSAFDVEAWLMAKIAARFARQENAAFFSGDGAGEPKGLLDYGTVADADFTWGADPALYTIGATYSGAAGTLGSTPVETLGDLVDSLKSEYLPGAVWMMPRAMKNLVRDLQDSQGRFYFQPSLSEGAPDTLMGYPLILAEDMAAPAADTVGAFFGNFREAYTIVDRQGSMQIIRDPFTSPGSIRFYVAKRVGGALTNPEAVKALVMGATPA